MPPPSVGFPEAERARLVKRREEVTAKLVAMTAADEPKALPAPQPSGA